MPAAFAHRRALVLTSIALYALVFGAVFMFERPGLGIGHVYYIAVALLALGGGVRWGIGAGAAAAAFYAVGVAFNPEMPTAELLSASAGIRLVTYTAMGGLIGSFAAHNRDLVATLKVLAERDALTGLPNTRAFEAAIDRRLESGRPFTLLLGDVDGLKAINETHGHAGGNDALRRLGEMLASHLRPEDDVARVGGDEFAVLSGLQGGQEASQLCARLEAALGAHDVKATFGWAVYPLDSMNALSLYRAADERLYARKLVRGRERGGRTIYPVSA
jgi:diguanylate cyclase (GGDEF)-like protein